MTERGNARSSGAPAASPRRPKRRDGLAWREIDGLVVIVDPATSTMHDLSDVATFYWLRMDGVSTVAELAEVATVEYEVEEDEASADLLALVTELDEKGLLEK